MDPFLIVDLGPHALRLKADIQIQNSPLNCCQVDL